MNTTINYPYERDIISLGKGDATVTYMIYDGGKTIIYILEDCSDNFRSHLRQINENIFDDPSDKDIYYRFKLTTDGSHEDYFKNYRYIELSLHVESNDIKISIDRIDNIEDRAIVYGTIHCDSSEIQYNVVDIKQ